MRSFLANQAMNVRRTGFVGLLAAAAVTACACLPGVAAAVVGGAPASAGEWPWLARIVAFDGARVMTCSGSVIAPNIVLTAGHCAVDETTLALLPAADFDVTTGTRNWLTSPGQVSAVSRVVLYPGWSPSSGGVSPDGDVAVLQLATPTTAPALPLASPNADAGLYAPGTAAAVAGWGRTVGSQSLLPDDLRWTTTTVQSTSWCEAEATNQFGATLDAANQMCAIDAPSDRAGICWGDSGGPLVARDPGGAIVEIGIASSMATDCSVTAPDFFQRIDAVSPWLTRETAELSPPAATTAGAGGVGRTGATLAGQVNPDNNRTRYYFQYGRTSSYGSKTVRRNVIGSTAMPVSAVLNDLKPGTVYHYRLVAVNANGTGHGADQSFRTLAAPMAGTYRGKTRQLVDRRQSRARSPRHRRQLVRVQRAMPRTPLDAWIYVQTNRLLLPLVARAWTRPASW